MKSSFTIRALSAIAFLSASMLLTTPADANQTAFEEDFNPYATSFSSEWGSWSQTTLTCNTNYPDWDSACTDGDYMSVKWWVRTTGQAMMDIEYGSPYSVNLNNGDDWECSEVLYCDDGTTPGFGEYGIPCGWDTCPSGISARKAVLYISMTMPN